MNGGQAMEPDSRERYLTLKEAARVIRRAPKTLSRWLSEQAKGGKNRGIPAIKMDDGRWLIPHGDYLRWVDGHKEG